MVDKKVQFNVVVGGIPQIKNSLKGVTESARSMNLSVQQMGERTAQRIVEIERNKLAALKRINDSETTNAQQKARQIASIEENLARQITTIKEREALRVKHMNEKFIQNAASQQKSGLNLNNASQLASSAGLYRTGHVIRLANQLGIGSSIGGSTTGSAVGGIAQGAGAAGGAAGLAEIAAIAAPVAVALGAVVVAAKLVEIGFNVVSTQAQYLASSFIGAISEIGGAKNLQDTLVHAAESERQTKILRMAVLPEERASEDEINKLTSNLAKNPQLGAFDSTEWKKAIDILGVGTGEQKTFVKDPSTLQFIGNMAHLRGMPLSEMANLYGEIKQQNPDFSHKDVQDTLLRGTALGRKTSFDITDLTQSKVLMTQSTKLSGDRQENLLQLLGVGAALKPYAEGGMLGAGVETQAFLSEAGKSHRSGQNYGFNYDKAGNITNLREGIAFAVSHRTDANSPYAKEQRAERFVEHISAAAGVTGDDTDKQKQEKVMEFLAANDQLMMSFRQLSEESEQTISTSDRMKAEFNRITDEMGTALLPVLQQLEPSISTLGTALSENKEQIVDTIKSMVSAMLAMIPAALSVGSVLAKLGEFVGNMITVIATVLDEKTLGVFHTQLSPFEKAGDEIAKSQKALAETLDKVKESFEKLNDGLSHNHGASSSWESDSIPEVTIVGHKEVVRAIQDMHHDLKNNYKQPL